MSKEVETYKLFRQLEAREKRTNPYKFYDKDELIDEILKDEDEIERLNNIIKEVREYIEQEEISIIYQELGLQQINVKNELLEILNKGDD